MAHTTVFAHNKGGTGKTTACVNIAGFLSKKGENVLVVDGDPQANATSNLGLDMEYLDRSLYDALLHQIGMRDIDDVSNCVYPTAYGVDLLPGSQNLDEAYNMLWEQDGRSEELDELLYSIDDKYDHVLIDAPSSHLNAIAAGIRAADSFYLVMDSSFYAHEGTGMLRSFLRRLPDRHSVMMNPTRVLFTDTREQSLVRKAKHAVFGNDHVKRSEQIAKSLFGTRFHKIPYCEHVIRSQREKLPLSHFENVPDTAAVYEELAEDLRSYRW